MSQRLCALAQNAQHILGLAIYLCMGGIALGLSVFDETRASDGCLGCKFLSCLEC